LISVYYTSDIRLIFGVQISSKVLPLEGTSIKLMKNKEKKTLQNTKCWLNIVDFAVVLKQYFRFQIFESQKI